MINIELTEHRTSKAQRRTSNNDVARAAQALAPRVTPSFFLLILILTLQFVLFQRSIRLRRTSACSPMASWTFDVRFFVFYAQSVILPERSTFAAP